MKIKWLGHASFLITSDDGTKIITDPYVVGDGISYGEIRELADIVTISHQHADHSNAAAVRGNPQVITKPEKKKVKGINIKGVASYHDKSSGKERGDNIIFCFNIDGIAICHLGDLGHTLNDKQIAQVGKVDIVMVPTGGTYTIDAITATQVCAALKAKVIIPMHYSTPKCTYPITKVEDFTRGKVSVKEANSSEVDLTGDKLPPTAEIIILKYAL